MLISWPKLSKCNALLTQPPYEIVVQPRGKMKLLFFMKWRNKVLACARPALHRPALPCTPLHCALDMDSYCICRPPGGTMMASGRAYSATWCVVQHLPGE